MSVRKAQKQRRISMASSAGQSAVPLLSALVLPPTWLAPPQGDTTWLGKSALEFVGVQGES